MIDKNLEEGNEFTPRFDDKGLITAVVSDSSSQAIVMVAYMNKDALQLTLQTGIAHFWSRSRQQLWKKGETSGNFLLVQEIRTDCDQDALWLKVAVQGDGKACHTGRVGCFYRIVKVEDGKASLTMAEDTPAHLSIFNKNKDND